MAGRSAPGNSAPGSASSSARRTRADMPSLPLATASRPSTRPFAISPEISSNTISAVLNRATPLSCCVAMPGNSTARCDLNSIFPASPGALQTNGSVDQPAALASRRIGMPMAAATIAGASSDSASITPSILAGSPMLSARRPCTLLPPNVPESCSNAMVVGWSSWRRITPLPVASIGPASSLPSKRRSRPSGPDAASVSFAGRGSAAIMRSRPSSVSSGPESSDSS